MRTCIGRANAEAFSELLFLLPCHGWCGLNLATARRGGLWPGFTFMAHVRHFAENVLLEPFEPEINHRRHKSVIICEKIKVQLPSPPAFAFEAQRKNSRLPRRNKVKAGG